MNSSVKWLLFAVLNLVVAIASGCGGGGPASGAGATPAAAKEVTGVAATGAPIANGTVFIKDSSDAPTERHQSTRSDGSFTFDASGLKPPFFLKTGSNNQNLYSIATDFGMTNITPLTTLVVAQAAQRSDLDTLYTSYKPADIISIAQKMPDADKTIQNMLAPLMIAFDCKGSLVNGPFSANHTGLDALIDTISVSVVPGAISVRQKSNNTLLLNVAANQLGGAVISTNAAAPITSPAPTSGSALYTTKCAGCHGSLASSSKTGVTAVRLQNAIGGNIGGMGFLSTLSAADIQSLVTALNPTAPAPTPAPILTPTPDGAALYSANCAGCHGSLASSSKTGITIARLQSAIANNTGGMGFLSTLSAGDVQALVTVLTPATTTPTPTPIPPTPVVDGPTLYGNNCASCHGALASSSKAGATASRIQAAISNNTGSMGSLSTLSSAQIAAIETALATVAPTPAPTPAPAPVCGSCHAIPPATGQHSIHLSAGVGCATCHGSGYSTASFNAATHNNGVKNVDTARTGWNALNRTCSNSCHGSRSW